MHRGKRKIGPCSLFLVKQFTILTKIPKLILFVIIILCLTQLHEKDITTEMMNEEIENEIERYNIDNQFILDPR